MVDYRDQSFNVIRAADRSIIDGIQAVIKETGLEITSAQVWLHMVEADLSFTSEQVTGGYKGTDLEVVLEQESELIRQLIYGFADNVRLTLVRPADKLNDTLNIRAKNTNLELADVVAISASVRKHLKAFDPERTLGAMLGEDAQRHYQVREAELAKLEAMVATMTREQEKFRQRQEEELTRKSRELDEKFTRREEELKEEYRLRDEAIASKEGDFAMRLEEIDDREARHARRSLREDLKKALLERGETFQLTKGTQDLRKTVYWFTIILLAIFGVGTAVYTFLALFSLFQTTAATATEMITVAIKQVAFAFAFGSTAVFFIRWNNQYFERHAREEFQLKRMELDIDRASWLVEMALEWKEEKGSDIPPELIERLSRNLFVEHQDSGSPLHPADQIASLLVGAASGAKITGPGGAEMSFDRKSIKKIQKDAEK